MEKEIYFLVSYGQLLNSHTFEILNKSSVLCFSSYDSLPYQFKAKIVKKPRKITDYPFWFIQVFSILRSLKKSSIIVYTPHLGPFLANVLKNTFSAKVVFVSEGMLDSIIYKMDRPYYFKSILRKILAFMLGWKYVIYKEDLRDGNNVMIDKKMPSIEIKKIGNNALIVAYLFSKDRRVNSKKIIELIEKTCNEIGVNKVYYKPHPRENNKNWPGKENFETINSNIPAELIVEEYNIGYFVGVHSTALLNVQKMYNNSVVSISVGMEELLEANILTFENIKKIKTVFMNYGVRVL